MLVLGEKRKEEERGEKPRNRQERSSFACGIHRG